MNGPPPGASPNPLREVRTLGRATAMADDDAVTRIVGFLDGLVERGELDRILDPVRPRLRGLGTPRRLRFPRLLFLPLDGVIVSPQDWNRGQSAVPRSALRLLAEAVQRDMGPAGAEIAAAAADHTTHSTQAITAFGARTWPAAARLLPEAPPPGWQACGLASRDYAEIAGVCRPLWAAGETIWAAVAASAAGPPAGLAQAAFAAVAPAGAEALGAVLATLLLRASKPGQVIEVASGLNAEARRQAILALDRVMEAPLPAFAELRPRQTTGAALALADRLDDLANCALMTSDRQKRLAARRRVAETAFRASYMAALEQHMLAPVERLRRATAVEDPEVAAMEVAARELRALEAAGRRLGGGAQYDAAAQAMARRIGGLATELAAEARPPGGLQPMDLARCVEILAGPEAGALILDGAAGP